MNKQNHRGDADLRKENLISRILTLLPLITSLKKDTRHFICVMHACECACVYLCEKKNRKEVIAYSKENMCWAVQKQTDLFEFTVSLAYQVSSGQPRLLNRETLS